MLMINIVYLCTVILYDSTCTIHRLHIQVPNLSMCCSDLTSRKETTILVLLMSTRATYLITSWPTYDVTLNWCLAKRGQVKHIDILMKSREKFNTSQLDKNTGCSQEPSNAICWLLPLWFKFNGNFILFSSREVIAMKFCTLHDSCLSCHFQNFVAIWYDGFILKPRFHWILIAKIVG